MANQKVNMNTIADIYDKSEKNYVKDVKLRSGGNSNALETIEYFDPYVYGHRDWDGKPDDMTMGSSSRRQKGAKSCFQATGFMDCACGKRLEATCPRKYKLLIKLHFKSNPKCKNIWEKNYSGPKIH